MSHFNFQILRTDGRPRSEPVRVKSEAGIILRCPMTMIPADIKHLCALARETPNYPVDITAWAGPDDARYLTWAARISYETGATGLHKIRGQAE